MNSHCFDYLKEWLTKTTFLYKVSTSVVLASPSRAQLDKNRTVNPDYNNSNHFLLEGKGIVYRLKAITLQAYRLTTQ